MNLAGRDACSTSRKYQRNGLTPDDPYSTRAKCWLVPDRRQLLTLPQNPKSCFNCNSRLPSLQRSLAQHAQTEAHTWSRGTPQSHRQSYKCYMHTDAKTRAVGRSAWVEHACLLITGSQAVVSIHMYSCTGPVMCAYSSCHLTSFQVQHWQACCLNETTKIVPHAAREDA